MGLYEDMRNMRNEIDLKMNKFDDKIQNTFNLLDKKIEIFTELSEKILKKLDNLNTPVYNIEQPMNTKVEDKKKVLHKDEEYIPNVDIKGTTITANKIETRKINTNINDAISALDNLEK